MMNGFETAVYLLAGISVVVSIFNYVMFTKTSAMRQSMMDDMIEDAHKRKALDCELINLKTWIDLTMRDADDLKADCNSIVDGFESYVREERQNIEKLAAGLHISIMNIKEAA